MAIQYFVPEVWSAHILTKLRDSLVYAQPGVVNRNYEGDIARAGDTVHILSVTDPSVSAYTKNAGTGSNAEISYELLSDSEETLTVDQSDYFAFQVDDIDKRQALPGFVEEAARGAAYKLAAKMDAWVGAKMIAGAGNDLGSLTVGVESAAESAPGAGDAVTGVYDFLVQCRTKLNRSNTPAQGRFVIVPPEMYALLLRDDRFIRADASGTTAGLRNGEAGNAAGFTVLESNVVPEASGAYSVVAGHSEATTVAEQILKTEALRREGSFSDAVRGLHVYGGKVLAGRDDFLVKSSVTVKS